MEQTKDLASLIRKAGKSQRVAEFLCPFAPEFYVTIAYASKFVLNQIREVSRTIQTNFRTREREERLDDDKLRKEYARQIIVNWRGLTGEKLQKLVPGIEIKKSDLDKEIPYTQEVAISLLEVSMEFENWVIDICTNVENYSHIAEQKEKEQENLK